MDNSRHNNILNRPLSRRTLFRGAALTGIGAAGFALAGCGDDDDDDNGNGGGNGDGGSSQSTLERARSQGYINIGFANEAPYGFADAQGNVTGEAPTLGKEILSRLDIPEINGVVVPFGSLIPGLQAGRFDIIAAGMFINPDRCANVLFSDPDYCVPQAFGVASGNPLGLNSYEDVAANSDATLGVQTGAVEEGYATAAGVSEGQIQFFDDIASMGEALASGRIDAMAATSLAIASEIERLDSGDVEMTATFEVEIDGEPQSGCGGFGFRQDDQELRDAFNDILVEMKDNGEVRPLVEEFGFGDEVDAAVGRTAEELCEE